MFNVFSVVHFDKKVNYQIKTYPLMNLISALTAIFQSSQNTSSKNDSSESILSTTKNDRTPIQKSKIQCQAKKRSFVKCYHNLYETQHLGNKCVIDPNGKIYLAWMCISSMAVLYNVWVIPLRSTFPVQTISSRTKWMIFDYLADCIYVLDILCIQVRIKFLKDGFWVTNPGILRKNYVNSKCFKMDLLSLFPLDVFYLLANPELVILRFPRFFKIHTFWMFFSSIDKLLPSPYFIRIAKSLLYMMYLIHINACAYYAFSIWEGIGSNNFVFNGKGNAYIRCFYFATKTATSIGKNPKPTLEAEYIFMTVSWLMGVFVFALLIGQIRDIISTATRLKTEYRKLVDETLKYMRRLNLPIEMQGRAKSWFNYTWKTQRTLNENYIMDFLPNKMKTDIAISVHIQTLSKVKLFANCDEALLRELVLQLKSVIFLPFDLICKKGDVGNEMYIIQSGIVEVIGGVNNKVLATLSEGSVFGEISLLGIAGKNKRTADVRSKGHSNLFVLSKSDLNTALSHYPEAQQLLSKKARLLIRKNAVLENENSLRFENNPLLGKNDLSEHELCSYKQNMSLLDVNNKFEPSFQAKVMVHRTLS